MAGIEEPRVNVQITLRGAVAEKVLSIADREGNPLSSVLRRLVSIGLREEENGDT